MYRKSIRDRFEQCNTSSLNVEEVLFSEVQIYAMTYMNEKLLKNHSVSLGWMFVDLCSSLPRSMASSKLVTPDSFCAPDAHRFVVVVCFLVCGDGRYVMCEHWFKTDEELCQALNKRAIARCIPLANGDKPTGTGV